MLCLVYGEVMTNQLASREEPRPEKSKNDKTNLRMMLNPVNTIIYGFTKSETRRKAATKTVKLQNDLTEGLNLAGTIA